MFRSVVFSVVVAALAPRASATFIVLSDNRTITATDSGSSLSKFATGSVFNDTVEMSGASSVAFSRMDSRVTDVSMSFDSLVYASMFNVGGGRASNSAVALFDIMFRVEQPTMVSITGWRDFPVLGIYDVSLTNVTLNWGNFPEVMPFHPALNQTALLAPDTYRLFGRVEFRNLPGITDSGSAPLVLSVREVPDTGASVLLLALAASAIFAWRNKSRQPSAR